MAREQTRDGWGSAGAETAPHGAGHGGGVVAAELDLGGVVGGEEGELALQVRRVGVLVLRVRHRKQHLPRPSPPLLREGTPRPAQRRIHGKGTEKFATTGGGVQPLCG